MSLGPDDTFSATKVNPEVPSNGDSLGEDGEKIVTKKDIFLQREMVCDKALISAVKTLATLQRDQSLLAYSKHPRIMNRFQDKYSINISFSLHVGRSIEGTIGSEFKVDALYLSADT